VTLAGGIAYASLRAAPGHIRPGRRASLVDALMDLPEVRASTRMQATIPLGDVELLQRLRERTQNPVTRAAGSTALLDAAIPPCAPGSSATGNSRGPRHHDRRVGGGPVRTERRASQQGGSYGGHHHDPGTAGQLPVRDPYDQEIMLHAIKAWAETAGDFTPGCPAPPSAHRPAAQSP
jgi:hypothetical protein